MVTYSDLIQFCMFIVALVGLCYKIFRDKRKQPPLLPIVTADVKRQLNIVEGSRFSGFPSFYVQYNTSHDDVQVKMKLNPQFNPFQTHQTKLDEAQKRR